MTLVPGGGVRDTFLELGVMLDGVNGKVDGVFEVSVVCVTGVTGVTEELLALVEDLLWLVGGVIEDPTEPGGRVVVPFNDLDVVVEPIDVVVDE